MGDENAPHGNTAASPPAPHPKPEGHLRFAPDFQAHQYRLIEIPTTNFLDDLEKCKEFTIKGEEESALGCTVLCTQDKTFVMRKAETSNTMLLLDGLVLKPENAKTDGGRIRADTNVEIGSIATHVFELAEHKPSLVQLRNIFKSATLSLDDLEQAVLKDDEGSDADSEDLSEASPSAKKRKTQHRQPGAKSDKSNKCGFGLCFDDLLGMVLASEKETLAALREIRAFEYKGRWHCLDEHSFIDTFDMVLTVITAKCLSLDKAPEETVCSDLIDTPEVAIVETLRAHSKKFKADHTENGRMWELDPVKVTRFRLEQLLKSKPPLPKEELFDLWRASLPRGSAEPTDDHLSGLAVRKNMSGADKYYYFNANALSDNPARCFKQLFAFKERWVPEEMEPYLQHLEGPDCGRAQLLRKYTRLCRDTETKAMILCAR